MKAKNETGVYPTADLLIKGLNSYVKEIGLKTSYCDQGDDVDLWSVLFEGLLVPYSQNAKLFKANMHDKIEAEKKEEQRELSQLVAQKLRKGK